MAEASAVRLPGVMWHVTITLHGQPQQPALLHDALSRLAYAHGIGLSARFSADTTELRYWDEGQDCKIVADGGLGLWDMHRQDLSLPTWAVVGIEVLDRPSFRRRWPPGTPEAQKFVPGVQPM